MRTANVELNAVIVWALATFHASLFMLIALLFLYWQNVLRNILPTLNTAVGLGLFTLLWAITWWTTRRLVAGMHDDSAIVGLAARWGAVNGVLFLLIAGAGAAVFAAATSPDGASFSLLIGVAFFGMFGSLFAFGIGGAVGFVLGVIDLGLLKISRRLTLGAVS